MGPQLPRCRQRVGAGAGHPDGPESVDVIDEAPVDLGDHEVVVHDQHVTHGLPARRECSRTRNCAPPSGPSCTSTVPPCWAVTRRTSARPIPRPPGTSGLEVTPRVKIASRRCSGTPGPESSTEIVSPSRSSMCTRHARIRRTHRHVHGVVDEVAQQGDHIGRQRRVERREVATRIQLQCDAALGGKGCLGDQQRGHGGIGDPLRHRVTDLCASACQGAHQVTHRIVLTELNQPGYRVQLVGELVGLRPQGVGHALVRRQLSLQGGQFGAVPHRGHGSDPLTLAGGRPPVQRQHPRPGRDHDIAAVLAGSRSDTTAGSSPTASTRRPTASPVTPSRSWALSLSSVISPRCSPRSHPHGCCAAAPPDGRPGSRSRPPPGRGCAV